MWGRSDSVSELSSEPDEEAEKELMAAARGKQRMRQRKLWIVERLIPCKREKGEQGQLNRIDQRLTPLYKYIAVR
jgi:hypothetical protein